MIMDFNVNVNVKFDATPSLVGAVSTLVGALRPIEVPQPTIKVPAVQTVQSPAPVVQKLAQEQTVQTATVVEPAPQSEEQQSELSDEALRKIVGPITKDKGKEAVFVILDEFGVKRVPDLKPEQRQAFVDKLSAL